MVNEEEYQISPAERCGLSMTADGYRQEELDFLNKLNTSEYLPDIAEKSLFALFDRAVRNTNFDVHSIKAERARCDELLAWIRFNMPAGRWTGDMGILFRNIKMLHNAVLAGAYQGFNRKQFNTRFAHVTTERNMPEPQKQPSLFKRVMGL